MFEAGLGASQFTEQVTYQRALEGELANSIKAVLDPEIGMRPAPLFLFDELLLAIDASIVSDRKGDRGKCSEKQARALSILHALESSLAGRAISERMRRFRPTGNRSAKVHRKK